MNRYIIILILFIFSLFGCNSPLSVQFSSNALMNTSAGGDGDGEVFEGKPEGIYYSYEKDYTCSLGSGQVTRSYKNSISYEEPGYIGLPVSLGDKCSNSFTPLDPLLIDLSLVSSGIIIFNSDIYYDGEFQFESFMGALPATANLGESISIPGNFVNTGTGITNRYNLVLYITNPVGAQSQTLNQFDLFSTDDTKSTTFNYNILPVNGSGVYTFRVCVTVSGSSHSFFDFCSSPQVINVP